MTEKLPNQQTTWAGLSTQVTDFAVWRDAQTTQYASRSAELLGYLLHEINAESQDLLLSDTPAVSVLQVTGIRPRLLELYYAYLSITLTDDTVPAERLVRGYRLNRNLHPDYIKRTRCLRDIPAV
jgi:hypothetical protein